MSDEHPQDDDGRTIWPFVIAVAVFGVIVVAIVAAQVLSPSEDNEPESRKIRSAIDGYVAAHNDRDQERLNGLECSGFQADRAPVKGDDPVRITEYKSVQVDGDKATADLKVDGKDATWHFARAGGKWLVCT